MTRGVRGRLASWSLALCVALALPTAISLAGCKRGEAAQKSESEPGAPTLVVRDDSEGLLLTWIDERGDFHVEQRVSDVPLVGRDTVRVVDPSKEEGTHGEGIVVADLRQARSDGTYSVRALTRTEFDAFAISRREKHTATLASAQPSGPLAPPPETVGTDSLAPNRAPTSPSARPAVIIYGAEWCGACHQAAAWLKKKNIAFVEKDIEADATADNEMRAKLKTAGLRSGSIPVIDVRGVVMVGFSADKIEAALGRGI